MADILIVLLPSRLSLSTSLVHFTIPIHMEHRDEGTTLHHVTKYINSIL